MSRVRRRETGGASGIVRSKPVIDLSLRAHLLLPIYFKLHAAKTPYVVNYGGGGSGKSHAMGQYLVRRLLTKKHKLLVLRKYASTLNDSVIDLFREMALPFFGQIEGIHYKYNASRRRIELANGSVIIFKGLDDAEKFKSIQGITLVWFEETTEIDEPEFKVVSDRIRGEPQIYLTYNPISERHWLRARFHGEDPHRGIDSRTTVIFSTYLDNPYVGQKYIDDMAWYADHDPDHYAVYGLGRFGIIRPDNPYFTAWKRRFYEGTTIYNPHEPIHLSVDFNVKNTFLHSQHYGGVKVDYHQLDHGTGDLKEMCRQVAEKYSRNLIRWTGDASGNNRSAYTTGNASAWNLIQQYMSEFEADYCEYVVPTANASTASSRHLCNALLVHYGPKPHRPDQATLTIDRANCGLLIDDIERLRADSDGSLDKKDANKHNIGHAADTFRYNLGTFEYDTFTSLALSRKAA